jgi:hypothetical protein
MHEKAAPKTRTHDCAPEKAAYESLWTSSETCIFLNISRSQLHALSHSEHGLTAYRVGGVLRYDPADVRAWLRENAVVRGQA